LLVRKQREAEEAPCPPSFSTDTVKTDAEVVRCWRLEQLTRSGYDEAAARLLAELRHVDLHVAADLLSSGCPVETALRILV
jgi:hypothetical protein